MTECIMGNMLEVLQDSGVSKRPATEQEDVLVSELSELTEVDLWRVQWCLSRALSPPVPPHWLLHADAMGTAKTMTRCYHNNGAIAALHAVRKFLDREDRFLHGFIMSPLRPRTGPDLKPGSELVLTRRGKLVSMMQRPGTVMDILQKRGLLNDSNMDAVNVYAVSTDKNRALLDLVLMSGRGAWEAFHLALGQSEPFLLQELEDEPIRDKNHSVSSVLLELLVPDELRTLHWLVSDHMTDGEQQGILEKQTESIALKIAPALSVCLRGEAVASQNYSDIIAETNVETMEVDVLHEEFKDGNIFRLVARCSGVWHCRQTGLIVEGFGDVVYQSVQWDMDFLASKGLRPAGPMIRFTLLTGHFHRLHLPHCQLKGGADHLLSVAHVTDNGVDFISPGQVTDSHVVVDISGFCCFGLVAPAASSEGAISGLVLLFSRQNSLFVLLLPRNVILSQVIKEWQQRIRAEYVEAVPDCELIPNQTYSLTGNADFVIQPQSSKFINFSDYNKSLPSFQVLLPSSNVTAVTLQLSCHMTPLLPLIGWLFGSTESVVWRRVVDLRAAASMLRTGGPGSDSLDVTLQLLRVVESLGAEDLRTFQKLLSLQPDPIPLSRLENADRSRTVELMVQQHRADRAQEVAMEILTTMNQNQLAQDLHN